MNLFVSKDHTRRLQTARLRHAIAFVNAMRVQCVWLYAENFDWNYVPYDRILRTYTSKVMWDQIDPSECECE